MNKTPEIRKNIKPKAEGLIKYISQPFDVKHDLHISKEIVGKSSVSAGLRPASPPAPCPGQKEDVDQTLFQDQKILRVVREEILPALRFEIGDIIEEKINKILDERNTRLESVHCASCTCDALTHTQTAESVFDDSPIPCSAVFLDNSDIISETSEGKLAKVSDKTLTEETREQLQDNTFSNPIYHHKGQTILVHTQYGAKTMKFGAGKTSSRDDSQNQLENHPRQKGTTLTNSDERECLASALQSHIHELVDGNVFPDNKIADDLLVDNCLTEEECASVRKILDRKDKIRVFLCFIKGRDFDILKKFLGHIRSRHEEVADSIELKFEQNRREGKRCTKCVFCQLTSHVNLKYIVDDLWKSGLINDGLFSMIVQTDKPAGVQTELWNCVTDSVNKYSVQSPVDVSHTLADSLRKKHHYEHLAKGVEWMIYTNKKLVCICKIRNKCDQHRPNGSILSSISPMSSVSDVAVDQSGDTSLSAHTTEPMNTREPVRIGIEKVPVESRLLQDNVFTEDKTPPTVVEKHKLGDNSSLEENVLGEDVTHINAPDNELKTTGQPVYINPSIANISIVRKPRGSNSVLTTSNSDPVIKTCEASSVVGYRPCPKKRPSIPKQNVNLSDNMEILLV